MRFTNKDGTICYWWHKKNEPEEIYKQELANQKLCQLEDIEEELGINLITLFKSFEKDIWIKFDNKIMFVPYDKKDFVFYERNINCYPSNQQCGYTVSIDDYGKTWALTKEELL